MNLVDERFSSPSLRALLALAVVFVMLATTGWTALRHHKGGGDALAVATAAWRHGSVGGRPLPDPQAAPGVIARFFASVGPDGARLLAHRYPLVVGNLNGAPVALRYQANRRSLVKARAQETARSRSSLLTTEGRQDAAQRADRYASLLDGGRQILAFDPTGRGRAAEVFGDLGTAERVSLVVPGVDTDVLSFEREDDPARAPVGMARSLYAAEHAAAPRTRTAVIAWADYTTPQGVGLDASTGELAEQGAVRLAALVRSLPAHGGVSLFCHSYGSVLCGVAAPELPSGRVSDIAVFGSPGMRVDKAADLGTAARVWATRDSTDWIGDVPHMEFAGLGHGADPVSRSFGARVVTSEAAEGHAGYFRPGTDSLANFTSIALGRYPDVRCADGSDCTAGVA
ncbi:alpha/beta hydrolase family protein [Actinacidiphila glaucinigra]|uniref:alpha/beta hydrolase n=1 Tax=Actinacidiphila glaucinigra TaxID=235986 RepID=UPI002DDB74B9|nr:alpha/beta hydrolase [Actinacidiphila glaucinigra]WSD62293.1 alpha/beta hydrolase family protein [Actinacidiphila glaucinigra]